MERSSGYTGLLMRTCLLAVAGAAASVMGGLPVSAADEVNQERLLNVDKEPGNWLHHHQNYAAHRFSTLKEVSRVLRPGGGDPLRRAPGTRRARCGV